MKKLTNIIASLLFAVTFSSIAQAGSINVGVSGSLVSIDASGTEKDTDGTADTSTRTASVEHNNVPIGGLFLEYESDFYGLTLGFTHTPGSADVSKSAKQRNDVETSVTGDTTANSTARTFKAQAEVLDLKDKVLSKEVQTVDIYNLLSSRIGKSLSILVLDCEGMDLRLLIRVLNSDLRIKIIVFEALSISSEEIKALFSTLMDESYLIYCLFAFLP